MAIPTGGVVSHEPVAAQRAVLTFATVLALALGVCTPAAAADLTLDSAVGNPARSAKFVARDKARHPLEELTFFGVEPESTVVEIWPGGGYWTEILAPLLHDHGGYYVALQGKGGSETAELKPASSTLSSAARPRPIPRPMASLRRPSLALARAKLRPLARPISFSLFVTFTIG